MNHKALEAWGLYFIWLTNKYSVEYAIEWIDWYFKSDEWRAYFRGFIKAPIYQQSILKVHFENQD